MVDKSEIEDLLVGGPEMPPTTTAARGPRTGPRSYERDFDVVWSGVGPLPGAGSADGLGSTLSGVHFSVGKRT